MTIGFKDALCESRTSGPGYAVDPQGEGRPEGGRHAKLRGEGVAESIRVPGGNVP